MAVSGYLTKLKRGLGLAFGANFLHDFSITMFHIKYFIIRQNFNITPHFFLKISNEMW